MQKFGLETQIDIPIKLFSNHSERKTATQILQDQEISEQAIMQQVIEVFEEFGLIIENLN